VTRFASLSRVPPLVFYEKKGVDLSRFSHAADAPLLLVTCGVTKPGPTCSWRKHTSGYVGRSVAIPYWRNTRTARRILEGHVRWGRARHGFFHYNDNSRNCLDRSHGSLLPICLAWLPYLPWLTSIGFHFTVDCGMCWKLSWSESRIPPSYLPWLTSIFALIDFH